MFLYFPITPPHIPPIFPCSATRTSRSFSSVQVVRISSPDTCGGAAISLRLVRVRVVWFICVVVVQPSDNRPYVISPIRHMSVSPTSYPDCSFSPVVHSPDCSGWNASGQTGDSSGQLGDRILSPKIPPHSDNSHRRLAVFRRFIHIYIS